MKASSPHNKGPILPLVDGAGAMVYEQAQALYNLNLDNTK